jgi:sulfatase modifying factor 1
VTCCVPERGPNGDDPRHQRPAPSDPVPGAADLRPTMVDVPGGRYVMGERSELANDGDGEEPVEVEVTAFRLDATAVTNAEFAAFVAATGHVTTAEALGTSFVFAGLLPDGFPPTRAIVGAEWWRLVEGATWWTPEGPGSTVDDRLDHPVVHVSLLDAAAYADWRDVRLPTEAEWERAARAGTDTTWPWGDERVPGGRHAMNVWQGEFPVHDTGDDGYIGTAPVRAYESNAWGLWNMVGNVWEWTVDDFGLRFPGAARTGRRTLKGGSYLCHSSYCNRYRPAGRIGSPPDSTSGNVGFRCAASIDGASACESVVGVAGVGPLGSCVTRR